MLRKVLFNEGFSNDLSSERLCRRTFSSFQYQSLKINKRKSTFVPEEMSLISPRDEIFVDCIINMGNVGCLIKLKDNILLLET